MKANVVIGANYGDEGKGLVTDYLTAEQSGSVAIIRFNGGAQAGHTVQTPAGLRHVFRHFGSGTLAGASTYLSEFFIANPILFNEEHATLLELGISPQVTIHPDAIVTTPYDMYINQKFENFLANRRHGSCGVGVNETVERNLFDQYQITVSDLCDEQRLVEKLIRIRSEWADLRIDKLMQSHLTDDDKCFLQSDAVLSAFLGDIRNFVNHCQMEDYDHVKSVDNIIFEGAQGLRLDQNAKDFPHVTRSNTGVQNVSIIANKLGLSHLDIHYVSRCYLTRHGAGPLTNELGQCPYPNFKDETNVPHAFQGKLRFAPLNINTLQAEINNDLAKLSNQLSRQVKLVITCLDHINDKILVSTADNSSKEKYKDDFTTFIQANTSFDGYILSDGPTRKHLKSLSTDTIRPSALV